jgi:hypothetical protein
LPFTNKTSTTTLGYDFSPNGNNWTTNNISLNRTAISTFTAVTSTTWVAPAGVTSVNYLVVAGGGGAGEGGGGGGGYLTGSLAVTSGTSYTVTVGGGGTGSGSTTGAQGSNSVFSSITSIGGGGGSGGNGGSGGGGSRGGGTIGNGTVGQGNNGGAGAGNPYPSGGGGGAGAVGGNGSGSVSGNGGAGSASSISGSSVTYAGGGGGAGYNPQGNTTAGTGGSGGGGNGVSSDANGGNGTANLGGGGGGTASDWASSVGGNGGSGIVILSYTQASTSTYDSMTDVPTLTSATAANYPTWNPLDGAGSQTSYSNGNLQAIVSGNPAIAFTTMATPTTGKWYCEVGVGGVGQVGGDWMIGVSDSSKSIAQRNWTGASGWFYYAEGTIYNNGSGVGGWGASYTSGDIVSIALDLDAGTLSFYKNGVNQGVAYNTGIAGKSMMFALGTGTGSLSQYQAARINCGQQPFIYTPPSGFVALNTYNL